MTTMYHVSIQYSPSKVGFLESRIALPYDEAINEAIYLLGTNLLAIAKSDDNFVIVRENEMSLPLSNITSVLLTKI